MDNIDLTDINLIEYKEYCTALAARVLDPMEKKKEFLEMFATFTSMDYRCVDAFISSAWVKQAKNDINIVKVNIDLCMKGVPDVLSRYTISDYQRKFEQHQQILNVRHPNVTLTHLGTTYSLSGTLGKQLSFVNSSYYNVAALTALFSVLYSAWSKMNQLTRADLDMDSARTISCFETYMSTMDLNLIHDRMEYIYGIFDLTITEQGDLLVFLKQDSFFFSGITKELIEFLDHNIKALRYSKKNKILFDSPGHKFDKLDLFFEIYESNDLHYRMFILTYWADYLLELVSLVKEISFLDPLDLNAFSLIPFDPFKVSLICDVVKHPTLKQKIVKQDALDKAHLDAIPHLSDCMFKVSDNDKCAEIERLLIRSSAVSLYDRYARTAEPSKDDDSKFVSGFYCSDEGFFDSFSFMSSTVFVDSASYSTYAFSLFHSQEVTRTLYTSPLVNHVGITDGRGLFVVRSDVSHRITINVPCVDAFVLDFVPASTSFMGSTRKWYSLCNTLAPDFDLDINNLMAVLSSAKSFYLDKDNFKKKYGQKFKDDGLRVILKCPILIADSFRKFLLFLTKLVSSEFLKFRSTNFLHEEIVYVDIFLNEEAVLCKKQDFNPYLFLRCLLEKQILGVYRRKFLFDNYIYYNRQWASCCFVKRDPNFSKCDPILLSDKLDPIFSNVAHVESLVYRDHQSRMKNDKETKEKRRKKRLEKDLQMEGTLSRVMASIKLD